MLHYPTRPQRVAYLKSLGIEAISLDSLKDENGRRLIQNLRTDEIARLRLGIAPPAGVPDGVDLSDYVLSEFGQEETEDVDEMIQRAIAACECWLEQGTESTMNRFNG